LAACTPTVKSGPARTKLAHMIARERRHRFIT